MADEADPKALRAALQQALAALDEAEGAGLVDQETADKARRPTLTLKNRAKPGRKTRAAGLPSDEEFEDWLAAAP